MSELPGGRVTFLFTDLEGSTRLVQELGSSGYGQLLALHSGLLRDAATAHGGQEFGNEGDAHFFVFRRADEALRAAVDAQRALGAAEWPGGRPVRVRMGLHTGEPELRGQNYVGVDLNRVARIAAAGHGGQILASEATEAQAPGPTASVRFVDLGQHRLKDLVAPEHLFQVMVPGLLAEFPPIRTIDTRPKLLPAQVSSFIGRQQELSAVLALIADHRLVTLSGPGGSGKTRLAIAAADRALPAFEDGVFFVPLAALRDPEMVAPTAAAALGVREATGRPVLATLIEYLEPRQLLLALDNFEHLLGAARVIKGLLESAPRLKVTSRILLRLYGERGLRGASASRAETGREPGAAGREPGGGPLCRPCGCSQLRVRTERRERLRGGRRPGGSNRSATISHCSSVSAIAKLTAEGARGVLRPAIGHRAVDDNEPPEPIHRPTTPSERSCVAPPRVLPPVSFRIADAASCHRREGTWVDAAA